MGDGLPHCARLQPFCLERIFSFIFFFTPICKRRPENLEARNRDARVR